MHCETLPLEEKVLLGDRSEKFTCISSVPSGWSQSDLTHIRVHWDLDMLLGHYASLLLTLLTGQTLSFVQTPVPACVQHLCPLGTFDWWALFPEGTSDSDRAEMWDLCSLATCGCLQ